MIDPFMKVLVLEDDHEDWILLQAQVRALKLPEPQPIELELATTIAEAEEKAAGDRYDFIIADFHLPDGEALSFLVTQLQQSQALYALLVSNDEQLVTLPAVGDLLRSHRVSFCVKSDLDARRLQTEFRAAQGMAGQAATRTATANRILLVDDDPEELEMLRWHCDQLEGMRVEVDRAGDTAQALQMAAATRYSLILVDFRLKREMGTETIHQLVEAGVRAPMFLITDAPSFISSQDALRCLGHRRAGFISKSRLNSGRIRQALQTQI